MWITNGNEKCLGSVADKNKDDYLLNAELINSLGYLIGEQRDGSRYDIETICVTTGLVRYLVCGKVDVGSILKFEFIIGSDGVRRNVDELFSDYQH